jgi:hypothetical protein
MFDCAAEQKRGVEYLVKRNALLVCINDICKLSKAPTNMDRIARMRELCDTFNVLALPKMFVGVDAAGFVHVTIIRDGAAVRGPIELTMSMGVHHAADVIWQLDSSGSYTIIKDRTGSFGAKSPVPVV